MTVEALQTLSIAFYIAAGVLLLVSAVLFFLLDVPKLYGDVSGRTARKAIEAIRRQNEATGNKAYKPSAVNAARGRVTDKITPSGKLISKTADLAVGVGTEELHASSGDLPPDETTILADAAGETVVLEATSFAEETTVLPSAQQSAAVPEKAFATETALSFAESTEIIE